MLPQTTRFTTNIISFENFLNQFIDLDEFACRIVYTALQSGVKIPSRMIVCPETIL